MATLVELLAQARDNGHEMGAWRRDAGWRSELATCRCGAYIRRAPQTGELAAAFIADPCPVIDAPRREGGMAMEEVDPAGHAVALLGALRAEVNATVTALDHLTHSAGGCPTDLAELYRHVVAFQLVLEAWHHEHVEYRARD